MTRSLCKTGKHLLTNSTPHSKLTFNKQTDSMANASIDERVYHQTLQKMLIAEEVKYAIQTKCHPSASSLRPRMGPTHILYIL